MKAKRLVLDIDFQDLTCVNNLREPQQFADLISKTADARFDSFLLDTFFCGTALYHSKVLPLYKNKICSKYGIGLADVLKAWDPLAVAVESAAKTGLSVIAYFRMLEEAYAPFDGHDFFQQNPQYWLQSRCGNYRYVGWQCYNYPEVREHMLARLDDVVSHGVKGVLFDLQRTHVPYFNAISLGEKNDSFGYNKPVVDEFKKRYGIDISKFEYVEPLRTVSHGHLPFTYDYKWEGTAQYDPWLFKKLIGEGYELFLRQARSRHPNLHIALQCYYKNCLYQPGNSVDDVTFFLNLNDLARDGVIDEYVNSANYQQSNYKEFSEPCFDALKNNGIQISAWLNDFISTTGGGEPWRDLNDIQKYIKGFTESSLNSAWLHELAFMLVADPSGSFWKLIRQFKK